MHDFHTQALERLYETIAGIDSAEGCRRFFEDICTIKELQDMSQRLEVAILLKEGKNYQEISAQTRVSTATISRVNKCLHYGTGGYRDAIERMTGGEE